jgi:hypothetical protein
MEQTRELLSSEGRLFANISEFAKSTRRVRPFIQLCPPSPVAVFVVPVVWMAWRASTSRR